MRSTPLGSALLVMLAVWTVLASGSVLSALIGGESAALLVFCLAAALLIMTRRPSVVRPRLRDAALFGLALALGFAGHPPLRGVIALVGFALRLDPSLAAPPGGSGFPLLIAVVVVAPVFEEPPVHEPSQGLEQRVILRALAQLLVEKGVITRDEFAERLRSIASEQRRGD